MAKLRYPVAMPPTTTFAALLSVLLLAVGCAAPGGRSGDASPASLVGTSWVCRSIDGTAVPASDAPTLRFDEDGRIGGSGGVNRYGAELRRAGSSIEVAPIMSTKMAAEPARMEIETRYFEALRQATRLERSGDELRLLAGDRLLLVLSAAGPGDR